MKNVQMTVDKDGILTIKIDTKQEHGLSSSGKNIIIASTCGNVTIDGTDAPLFLYFIGGKIYVTDI